MEENVQRLALEKKKVIDQNQRFSLGGRTEVNREKIQKI